MSPATRAEIAEEERNDDAKEEEENDEDEDKDGIPTPKWLMSPELSDGSTHDVYQSFTLLRDMRYTWLGGRKEANVKNFSAWNPYKAWLQRSIKTKSCRDFVTLWYACGRNATISAVWKKYRVNKM